MAIGIFAALMFGLGWVVVRWLARRGAAEYRREATRLERIAAQSILEAASKALPLLQDDASFGIVESPAENDESLRTLAPELRKIVQRYERVESKAASQATISRSMIQSSALKQGFVQIGSVGSGTDVAGEIAVRTGEETIYELYPSEEPDPTFGTYRSVYHWIIAMSEEE